MLVSGFTNMWRVPGALTCAFCFAEVCFASTFCFPSPRPHPQVSIMGQYNFHRTLSVVLTGAWRWAVARLPWRPLNCQQRRLLPSSLATYMAPTLHTSIGLEFKFEKRCGNFDYYSATSPTGPPGRKLANHGLN